MLRGTTSSGCVGVNYTTGSVQYDQVCGRIIGYQIGSPDAFYRGVGRTFEVVRPMGLNRRVQFYKYIYNEFH